MQILIVGAGIAGLSLAKALEQRGMAVDLVERQTGELAVGAGLYLVGNATRALQQLGLLADVVPKAVPIETQRIFDWRGKLLGTIQTQDVWRRCGPCLCLPRNALHAILQAALVRTNVSLGKAVTDIRQSPAGCEVAFSDGTAGTYDLVVGADGVNSAVRRITFPADAPRYLGTICWRTITRNTAGIDGWTAMFGNGSTLGAIPVSSTDIYVYADIRARMDAIDEFSARSPLAPLFAGFGAPVFPLIENLLANAEVHFGRIEQVRMAEWVKGRVVLIGDAAHASSPSMASGGGMAMEDALVLAETITAGPSLDQALAAYAARRRPRVEWVQAQCAARDRNARTTGAGKKRGCKALRPNALPTQLHAAAQADLTGCLRPSSGSRRNSPVPRSSRDGEIAVFFTVMIPIPRRRGRAMSSRSRLRQETCMRGERAWHCTPHTSRFAADCAESLLEADHQDSLRPISA